MVHAHAAGGVRTRGRMNRAHLEFCSSDAWADALRRWIVPGALGGVTLRAPVLEVGPGPGRTTELLYEMTERLTAVEIDDALARALAERLGGRVRVVRGDARSLPFADAAFRTVLSFTMLHHVPSAEDQDALLTEVARVLGPGGTFVGVDSLDGADFRALHIDDVCVPVDPATVGERLARAGFGHVETQPNPYVMQFRATV
jgi:SAM-dependent methyltransferase